MPQPLSSPKSMDRLSHLPKDILLRILYFLSQEDAVRTSVLSKSWRYIWHARPNLDLSTATFKGNIHKFISVVDKNLLRYCDQRLCLEEFHLHMSSEILYDKSVWLLEKWIPLLTVMGVKKFRLSMTCDQNRYGWAKLPHVIFGEESLQDLCVQGFRLDQYAIDRIVLSKHLEKLSLEAVHVDGTFQSIICSPSLETINICDSNICFQKGVDFRNLNVLHLDSISSSLDDLFLCKFPSLKRLILSCCTRLESEIFVDAPNLIYFEFKGDFVPSISFSTTEWDSNIYVKSYDASSSWFINLKKLIESIRQSNICLVISYHGYLGYGEGMILENILAQDNDCDKPIAVESLKLDCDFRCFSALLNVLLCVCCPRDIGECDIVE